MRKARPAALLSVLAVLSAPIAAAQLAPGRAPLPPERPAAEESIPAGAAAADNTDSAAPEESARGEEAAGAPEAGEEDAPEADAAGAEGDDPASAPDGAEEESAPPEPVEPPMPQQLAEGALELGICLGRLAALGTVYERAGAVFDDDGACGITNPVRVTEIVPGVALSPPALMRCETATALAEWVARFALPASALLPERGPLIEVTQGSTYVCRRIGNAAKGALSEHAFGNAVDVMGFRFASGPPIPVQPREREGTPAEAFQRAVRATACLSFTTVLGPGLEDHEDHLHLDIKARESGFRLCQ